MKFTSEDLMKAMGLKLGDKVKFTIDDITYIGVVGFYDNVSSLILENKNTSKNKVNGIFTLNFIINKEVEYEILPKPKRIGDLKCKDFECSNCPMKMICMHNIPLRDSEYTLYDMLKELEFNIAHSYFFDQEIYDLLKKRLDKEVVEEC